MVECRPPCVPPAACHQGSGAAAAAACWQGAHLELVNEDLHLLARNQLHLALLQRLAPATRRAVGR